MKCKKCNITLPSRNRNRKGFTGLCNVCYSRPTSEETCTGLTRTGNRCKLRREILVTKEGKRWYRYSTLCKIHRMRGEQE
tara:strand:+ start:70 stop:309 length:240 start_codon:yes stop_codon:yes gene_type:complete